MTGPESEGKVHSEKRRETELGLSGAGGGGLGPGAPGVWRRKDEGWGLPGISSSTHRYEASHYGCWA